MADPEVEESAPEPPSIETSAIAAGIAAGCMMYPLCRLGILILYEGLPSWLNLTQRLPIGIMSSVVLQCCMQAAVGIVVGVAAAHCAEHKKVHHAAIAASMIAPFEAIPLLFLFDFYVGLRISAFWDLTLYIVRVATLLLAALYGAYMAQSFARNRNVRIE